MRRSAGLEFSQMRPRDAAAWLAAGRIDGAFISTDLLLEEQLTNLAAVPLGAARSDLVVASRAGDGRDSARDLKGAIIATHLPNATARWFSDQQLDVTIVAMGGAAVWAQNPQARAQNVRNDGGEAGLEDGQQRRQRSR